MTPERLIEQSYQLAQERYGELGVDTAKAIERLATVSISLNCWQGDDVRGFEEPREGLSTGGIQVTGGFPGRARTIQELQQDLEMACAMIPGHHRVNLHAMYGEFGGRRVDRNQIEPEHFGSWIEWARLHGLALDFNATCFAHEKAASGFTLSSTDRGIRDFWIEHIQRCRVISAHIGHRLGSPCMHDLWLPDGSKDSTVRRAHHRGLLKESLDVIFALPFDPQTMKDALEGKLFGIGSEAFVVGSHEFYLAYAIANKKIPCIDMGHFHPTESVADKISAIMPFTDEILLHVSRGVRWDSDHVVIFNDDIRALMEEIVRGEYLDRVFLALDFFAASINRVGAWVTGARATQKGLLAALLEPIERLRALEQDGNHFARLALLEEAKSSPLGAVWDYFCMTRNAPPADRWITDILRYERDMLRTRP